MDTLFSGGSVSAMTCDFGIKTTDPDGWYDGEDIFTGAATGQRCIPSTLGALVSGSAAEVYDAAQTPVVVFDSTDDNVANLTAGDLTAYVLYVPTPMGDSVS